MRQSQNNPSSIERTLILLILLLTTSCSLESETLEEQKISFAKNVESCVCRTMYFESDFPSGIRYSQIVDSCNKTVHDSNDLRYEDTLSANPKSDSLRCPEDLEDWLEVVEKDQLDEK